MKKITISFILMIVLFTVFTLNVYATNNGIMYKGTQSGSYVSSKENINTVDGSIKLLKAISITSLVGMVLSFVLSYINNKNGQKKKRNLLLIIGIVLLIIGAFLNPIIEAIV